MVQLFWGLTDAETGVEVPNESVRRWRIALEMAPAVAQDVEVHAAAGSAGYGAQTAPELRLDM